MRNVRENHVRPTVKCSQTVHCSEINSRFPFFFADLSFEARDLHSIGHIGPLPAIVLRTLTGTFRLGN